MIRDPSTRRKHERNGQQLVALFSDKDCANCKSRNWKAAEDANQLRGWYIYCIECQDKPPMPPPFGKGK